MEIVLQVNDPQKASKLVEYLRACDFVNSIQTKDNDEKTGTQENIPESTDFFSAAGLWENRNITVDSLRQRAWRQCSA